MHYLLGWEYYRTWRRDLCNYMSDRKGKENRKRFKPDIKHNLKLFNKNKKTDDNKEPFKMKK